MTADESVAGVPRLCARRADCTRPRGHDDECGPDRADTELADLRAEVERANRVIAEYERKVWRRDQRLLELEGVARTNAAWVQQQHAAAKEAREQVQAVRALHQRRDVFGMCPDDGCERTDCVEYDTCTYLHEDDLVRSECHHCMDADEGHAEWPCPTIAALDAVEPADQPHPTPEADEVQYEVAAQFQDGEVFTPEQMARGLGVFDEEAPVLVVRRVGDDEWLTLGSGGGFIHEYEVWDDPGDEAGS